LSFSLLYVYLRKKADSLSCVYNELYIHPQAHLRQTNMHLE